MAVPFTGLCGGAGDEHRARTAGRDSHAAARRSTHLRQIQGLCGFRKILERGVVRTKQAGSLERGQGEVHLEAVRARQFEPDELILLRLQPATDDRLQTNQPQHARHRFLCGTRGASGHAAARSAPQ